MNSIPHIHEINPSAKYGVHSEIDLELPPESIDTLWVSAFVSEKPKLVRLSRHKRLKKMDIKIPNQLSTRFKPYLDEMLHKEDVKHHKKKTKMILQPVTTITSTSLETIYDIQYKEDQAAKRIQNFWRFFQLILKLRYTCKAIRMVLLIQRITRGYLCRIKLPAYFESEWNAVLKTQSLIRRFISNRQWHKKHKIEVDASIKIQTIVRRKIAYAQYQRLKLYKVVIPIQALWRGTRGRLKADLIYLNKQVIPIQSLIRKYLAIKKIQILKTIYHNAAMRIQSIFRYWRSVNQLSYKIIQREYLYRELSILSYKAMEIYTDEKLTKVSLRYLHGNIQENVTSLSQTLQVTFHSINSKEYDYYEYNRQKSILSPLAIQQGWLTEIETNIKKTYHEIIDMKIQYIFNTYQQYEVAKGLKEDQSKEILDLIHDSYTIKLNTQQDIEDRAQWNFKRDVESKAKIRHMTIADEKRKWSVKQYTKNGKPDITKRILNNNRKYNNQKTFKTAGNNNGFLNDVNIVDLFAHLKLNKLHQNRDSIDEKMRYGKSEIDELNTDMNRIHDTMASIKLQTYQNQMHLYQDILKPITTVLEKSMMNASQIHQQTLTQQQQQTSKSTMMKDTMTSYQPSAVSSAVDTSRSSLKNNKSLVPFRAYYDEEEEQYNHGNTGNQDPYGYGTNMSSDYIEAFSHLQSIHSPNKMNTASKSLKPYLKSSHYTDNTMNDMVIYNDINNHKYDDRHIIHPISTHSINEKKLSLTEFTSKRKLFSIHNHHTTDIISSTNPLYSGRQGKDKPLRKKSILMQHKELYAPPPVSSSYQNHQQHHHIMNDSSYKECNEDDDNVSSFKYITNDYNNNENNKNISSGLYKLSSLQSLQLIPLHTQQKKEESTIEQRRKSRIMYQGGLDSSLSTLSGSLDNGNMVSLIPLAPLQRGDRNTVKQGHTINTDRKKSLTTSMNFSSNSNKNDSNNSSSSSSSSLIVSTNTHLTTLPSRSRLPRSQSNRSHISADYMESTEDVIHSSSTSLLPKSTKHNKHHSKHSTTTTSSRSGTDKSKAVTVGKKVAVPWKMLGELHNEYEEFDQEKSTYTYQLGMYDNNNNNTTNTTTTT